MEKNEMMRPNTSAADTEGTNAAETVGEGEIAAAAETVGRLGLDLLGALGEEENSVISPLSAYLCLGLVKTGAAGATLGELDALLGEEPSFLYKSLAEADLGGDTELAFANSLWADGARAALKEGFAAGVKADFDAEVYPCAPGTREGLDAMNCWVAEKTRGLVKKLREEPFPPETLIMLLSTLYFKAPWSDPFIAELTQKGEFYGADGTCDANYMQGIGKSRLTARIDGARGIILPYGEGETFFAAFLPDEGFDVRGLVGSLAFEKLRAALVDAQPRYTELLLPRFTAAAEVSLKKPLQGLGIKTLFNCGADLSKMADFEPGEVCVSEICQQVKLKLDESGTEAAAVTRAGIATCSLNREEPEKFLFNRPFLYGVFQSSTCLPLFMGITDRPGEE